LKIVDSTEHQTTTLHAHDHAQLASNTRKQVNIVGRQSPEKTKIATSANVNARAEWTTSRGGSEINRSSIFRPRRYISKKKKKGRASQRKANEVGLFGGIRCSQ